MSFIGDSKDILLLAKKKHDKDKYISALEETVDKYEEELLRIKSQLNSFLKKELVINDDHLELFDIYRNSNENFNDKYLENYSKQSVNLEIALAQLIDKEFFKEPNVTFGGPTKMLIPEDKKLILLLALKDKFTF